MSFLFYFGPSSSFAPRLDLIIALLCVRMCVCTAALPCPIVPCHVAGRDRPAVFAPDAAALAPLAA
eukprot:COSAG06_NODE_9785_length_1817_cov_270.115250_1_plen_65_part_10